MRPIDLSRLSLAKQSFTTRRVDLDRFSRLDTKAADLSSGDVVLARVEEIGHHTKIERPDGRRAGLFPGDEILLACGARYAPDQFEADCPSAVGPAHLAAAGGIAGVVRASHERMKPATSIAILGALLDRAGERVNLRDVGVVASAPAQGRRSTVIAVCGASMNSGKTYTAASLVRGLTRAGGRAAAIKITGTGSGGDLWSFKDAGAFHVSDFTDAGFATTYQAPIDEILAGAWRLIADAEARGAEVVVIEIADGLGQAETAAILRDAALRERFSGAVFAASDALSAAGGVAWLRKAGHRVIAVSGCLTRSPLAIRETRAATDAPCVAALDLWRPETIAQLAIDESRPSPVDRSRAA